MKQFKSVFVLGFGRFGKLWAELLQPDFEVAVWARHDISEEAEKMGVKFVSLEEGLTREAIFLAPPISSFEQVVRGIAPIIERTKPKLIADVLSVKMYPKGIFEKYLPEEQPALLTHPMFGPDSVTANGGFTGLPIMLDKFRTDTETFSFWKDYFVRKGLRVIEMTAEEHDRAAARSQGVAHFMGRVLEDFELESTSIDTLGTKKLLEIRDLAANDTWQLFTDLQTKNPYTKEMRAKLGESMERIYNSLLPNRVNQDKLVIGIQGGKGSFNEQAARDYLARHKITDFELVYLHTTENVLRELHLGNIDRGQFAIHNSLGGIVGESIEAMQNHKYHIVEEFAIQIAHALIIRKDVDFKTVDTVMAHPQVFAQCKRNLPQKYPQLKSVSGEGELVDHALVAEYLAEGKLPKNIAVMGSRVLAEIYNLAIIEDHLEDLRENFTSFLLVERPNP